MSTDEQENQIHAEMSRPCQIALSAAQTHCQMLCLIFCHFFFLPMVFFPLSKFGLTKSQALFTLRWHMGIRFGQTEP